MVETSCSSAAPGRHTHCLPLCLPTLLVPHKLLPRCRLTHAKGSRSAQAALEAPSRHKDPKSLWTCDGPRTPLQDGSGDKATHLACSRIRSGLWSCEVSSTSQQPTGPQSLPGGQKGGLGTVCQFMQVLLGQEGPHSRPSILFDFASWMWTFACNSKLSVWSFSVKSF